MNRTELVATFAEKGGITKKDSKDLLNILQGIVYEHMVDEDGVKLFDGVTLTRSYKEARQGRNPATGETIVIPAKYSPKCKFGKACRDVVNK